MNREDSGVIDLFAICARASASPARDLSPPDLRSIAAPAFTTNISDKDESDGDALRGALAKTSRVKLALGAGAAVLLVLGLVVAGVSGGDAEPVKASVAKQLPVAAAALPSVAVEPPVATPTSRAVSSPLPPPPTTGAPAERAPPRIAQPATAMKAMKGRTPSASGPKMIKVQSGGVTGH